MLRLCRSIKGVVPLDFPKVSAEHACPPPKQNKNTYGEHRVQLKTKFPLKGPIQRKLCLNHVKFNMMSIYICGIYLYM